MALNRIRQGITSLTKRIGTPVTINRKARGVTEPVPDQMYERGEQQPARTGTFRAIFPSRTEVYREDNLVSDETEQVVVEPGLFTPESGDTLVLGSRTAKILEVETVNPDGTKPLIHLCEVSW